MKILGILGGGQLGRMSALAAARLGIRVHVFCPENDAPALQVCDSYTLAAYDDRAALKAFANAVDVITYEFENIPVETVRYLQKYTPVWPDDRLLEVAQHRCKEKQFLNDIGIPTTSWRPARPADDLAYALKNLNPRGVIVKTARMGYDGKGQMVMKPTTPPRDVFKILKSDDLIVEAPVNFSCEISAIIARDKLGQVAVYAISQNDHRHHILARSTVPAQIPSKLFDQAKKYARLLADAVDLVGVMALEMFATKDGTLLANEIAPRTHNSGHWTIDACAVSQFEQHVRTVCSMTVGNPDRHSDAVMINLIGDDVKKIQKYMEMKNACVHLYGKDDVREGRKMGHVTLLKPRS